MSRLGNSILFWVTLLAVVAVDRMTKILAVERLSPAHIPHRVVGDVIRLTLAYNQKAAMGLSLGNHSRVAFAVIAALMLAALLLYQSRLQSADRVMNAVLGLIAGGAVGNLIDRVQSPSGVVDFIDVGVGTMRFWTFNVADSAVVMGATCLAVILLRRDALERSGQT